MDYSKGERRAGDYFVTRLSEHEWRRRGVEGRKREWGIGQRCSGEWMRAGGHIGDCKVGVEILPMSRSSTSDFQNSTDQQQFI